MILDSLRSETTRPSPSDGCGPVAALPDNTQSLRVQVFEAIRAAGLIPRVDLAKRLAVSPASVTATVAELIDGGFITEVSSPRREGEPSRGRPPVALGVRGAAGCVAGIKLSDQVHSAILIDFAGQVIADASVPCDPDLRSVDGLLAEAVTLLDALLQKCGFDRADLSAVGLGVPGMVDHTSGTVLWSPIFDARDFAIQDALTDRLGVQVRVDNDANLLTLAELWFGAGRRLPEFAVVTIEHGVGMGLVLNNKLYRGTRGLGMEIGHTKVQLDGALCRCGQRGCLEAYISDYALIREARTALNMNSQAMSSPHILLEALFNQAKAGNQAARSIFNRAGRFLALALANVVNIFDPNLIILSGERMRFDFLYANTVLDEMQHLMMQTGRPAPKIEIHAWGGLVWARGAAALALESATLNALEPGAVG